jgi:hypothetical protein
VQIPVAKDQPIDIIAEITRMAWEDQCGNGVGQRREALLLRNFGKELAQLVALFLVKLRYQPTLSLAE